ncbi:uncharacterized protein N0V89_001748 [Didymosphaeria variabile]|uniref:Uncharacterized protein n=1 Tax=Didymosphaeria variabile TaxID=1932322 RepID=A0A9W9CE13_9PLEO|nr:uncharacterized protein N0V89_001748 [Didymosphaeria variabile]KAJ4357173.1 hypothetical protein N0V89_001748 [Didymosphaeria variabile]
MIEASKPQPGELHLLKDEDYLKDVDFEYHRSLCLYLSTKATIARPACDTEDLAMDQGGANAALRQVSFYTPLLDKLNITFSDKRMNASLFNDPWTIYKAEPSKEVDAAWEKMSKTRSLTLEADEIRKMGKDPDFAVQVPLHWGYGASKYFAQLDSQHLLHCLNSVRKYSHYAHYFYPRWGDESNMPALSVAHRSHCIGILLDALTCQPSLNMLNFNWMETQENPFPDFAINRKCVDHSAVLEWQDRVGIREDLVENDIIKKPKDAKVLPALPQLLELED